MGKMTIGFRPLSLVVEAALAVVREVRSGGAPSVAAAPAAVAPVGAGNNLQLSLISFIETRKHFFYEKG
jgi:hypothetical protein